MSDSSSPKILISGGGTGGHVFPAISIANAIRRRHPDAEILFVGAEGRMEMERVPREGYEIVGLPVSGFDRHNPVKNIKVLYRLMKSLWKARKIVKQFAPDVAVGVGGYASGPVIKAAQRRKIPSIIQEQNSYAGVTNRLLADRATFGGRHLSKEQRARRAGAVRTVALPGGGAMDFVWCRNTELGRDIYDFTHYDDGVPIPDIEPSRLVLVTNFCYIGRTEVTMAQWNAVMGGGAEGDPEQPVLCTFRDAERFVRAMNALPAASNVVFRIPTEMEWEHGCRGISLCYFSHKNPEDVSWNAANSGGELHHVGQKKAVGYGLFDMHGNAPEWCADAFAPLGEGPLVNPFNAPATGDEDRVVRGGSCRDTVADMLADPRRGLSPDTGKAGFRLTMSDK